MTDIKNKITENEYHMMDNYILDYSGADTTVGSKKILDVWADAKSEYLYQLFGNELILSKQINIEKSAQEIQNELWANDEFNRLRLKIMRAAENSPIFYDKSGYYSKSVLNHAFVMDAFATGKISDRFEGWEWTNPETEKTYKISGGMKIMKAIGKIAEILHMEEDFERFRIVHSQVLNSKTYKGELCLSIHPMDYMTMSDNNNHWSSCMSWRGEGEYRQGTVEMMNSNCVIVAYLKSSSEKMFCGWNSKKWRSLFIVHPNFMTNVKGYPYNNNDLDAQVLEWLKELAEANCNWPFKEFNTVKYKYNRHYGDIEPLDGNPLPADFSVKLWTHKMYNDFGALDHQIGVFSDRPVNEAIYYSGPSQCMRCGDYEHYAIDEPQDLLCEYCRPEDDYLYCECCGERIYEGDEYYSPDGYPYCEYCYNDNFETDIFAGEDTYIETLKDVIIIRDENDFPALEEMDCLYVRTCPEDNYGSYNWRRFFGNAHVHRYEYKNPNYPWLNHCWYIIPDDFSKIDDYFLRNYTSNGYDFRDSIDEYIKELDECL